MSIRINRATTFNGKSYVITSELQKLISDVTFANDVLTFAGQTINGEEITSKAVNLAALRTEAVNDVTGNALVEDKIVLGNTSASVKVSTYEIGTTVQSNFGAENMLATEAGVKDYVDNKAISVSEGIGITINKTDVLNPIIGTNIKLRQKSSANGDAAASYELVYLSGENTYSVLNGSADIDIPKDQFLKSADFGWATNGDGTGWNAVHTAGTNDIPVLKFVVYTTTNGVTADKTLYIDCTSFYHDYTAGDGIDGATIASDNVIKVKKDTTSEAVYATSGAAAVEVLTISSDGVKIANIQSAIDTAVNDEHAKTSAAVTALDGKIDSSVANVNTTISSIVADTNTAITSAIGNVDAAVTSTVAAVNANVSAAVTKAVELEETTYNLTGTLTAGVDVTSGVVTVTGVTGNVLAVFGADGQQIYPEISKSGSKTGATNTLVADYGTETVDATWTILHTKAITYTDATAVATSAVDAITTDGASTVAAVSEGALTYKTIA